MLEVGQERVENCILHAEADPGWVCRLDGWTRWLSKRKKKGKREMEMRETWMREMGMREEGPMVYR